MFYLDTMLKWMVGDQWLRFIAGTARAADRSALGISASNNLLIHIEIIITERGNTNPAAVGASRLGRWSAARLRPLCHPAGSLPIRAIGFGGVEAGGRAGGPASWLGGRGVDARPGRGGAGRAEAGRGGARRETRGLADPAGRRTVTRRAALGSPSPMLTRCQRAIA